MILNLLLEKIYKQMLKIVAKVSCHQDTKTLKKSQKKEKMFVYRFEY